jgi:hypothetical protein
VISPDGKFGYVYNMSPASSVNIVDLAARKFVKTMELPGCASLTPSRRGPLGAVFRRVAGHPRADRPEKPDHPQRTVLFGNRRSDLRQFPSTDATKNES